MPRYLVTLSYNNHKYSIEATTPDEAAEKALEIDKYRLDEEGIKSIEIIPPEKYWTYPIDE